jgi:hypothetical protein
MGPNKPYPSKLKFVFYTYDFFVDGTVYKLGILGSFKPSVEEFFIDDYRRNRLGCWGGFIVKEDTIKMQIIDKSSFGKYYFKSEEILKIINDSTLVLYKTKNEQGIIEDLSDTLRYSRLSQNYESTNITDKIMKDKLGK